MEWTVRMFRKVKSRRISLRVNGISSSLRFSPGSSTAGLVAAMTLRKAGRADPGWSSGARRSRCEPDVGPEEAQCCGVPCVVLRLLRDGIVRGPGNALFFRAPGCHPSSDPHACLSPV